MIIKRFNENSIDPKIKNICDDFNALAHSHSFNESDDPRDRLQWLFDLVELGENYRHTSYEFHMGVFNCFLEKFRWGIEDDFGKNVKFPQIYDFMNSNRDKIKEQFNKIIQIEISRTRRKLENEIKDLESRIIN